MSGAMNSARTVRLAVEYPVALEQAAAILQGGELVAFPTDTVYGLGARAFLAEAVAGLCRVKERPAHLATSLLLPDATAMDAVCVDIPPPPGGTGIYTGKEEMRARWEEVLALNLVRKVWDCETSGNTTTCSGSYDGDDTRPLGIDFLEMVAEFVVEGGPVTSIAWTVTDESLAAVAPPPAVDVRWRGLKGLAVLQALPVLTRGGDARRAPHGPSAQPRRRYD